MRVFDEGGDNSTVEAEVIGCVVFAFIIGFITLVALLVILTSE